MLSSESIHHQMRNTASCSTLHLHELKELMDLYPYASSIVTLYLKSLANDQDLRLSSQLEKYAYQIPNRSLLYDLLVTQTNNARHEVKSQPEVIQETEKVILSDEKSDEPITANTVTPLETIPIVEMETTLISDEETEELETLIEPVAKSEVVITQETFIETEVSEEGAEESSLNIPHQVEETREMDEVDTLIQSAVISSSYLQLAYPGAAEEVETEEKKSVVEETENLTEETERNFDVESVATTQPKSFTDWLKMGQMIDEGKEEQVEEEKKPSFYHFEKPKKEFYSPAKKAKESVSENAMPVSETLAQIFALQGNINKAIQVYEQLSLSFPEKKSFFATQIRNLKRKLNS
ncbi:MAG: hypothetical protein RLZZ243_1242 [Bacteroidota bacterium]|jgi:hypothetical protein